MAIGYDGDSYQCKSCKDWFLGDSSKNTLCEKCDEQNRTKNDNKTKLEHSAHTAKLQWEYEDELEIDLTNEMFKMSQVDGVRMYPFVILDGKKYYLE